MNMEQFAVPRPCEIPPGAYGVWQIPSINVSIPVYQTNTPTTTAAAVDREDSASIRKWGAGRIIEDHAKSKAGSGRWQIGEVKPDMLGFLITPAGTQRYVCNRVMRAVRHPTCFTVDRVGVTARDVTDILCASCATADASEVYIAAFKLQKELNL